MQPPQRTLHDGRVSHRRRAARRLALRRLARRLALRREGCARRVQCQLQLEQPRGGGGGERAQRRRRQPVVPLSRLGLGSARQQRRKGGLQLAQRSAHSACLAGRIATAKRAMLVGLGIAAAILCGVGALIATSGSARAIASIFSAEPSVLDAFASARLTLALATVLMNLAVVLEGLLMTTGRTRAVLLVGLAGSWLGQVPVVFLLLRLWQRTLSAVYLGVSFGYGLLCVLLATTLCRLDWEAVAAEAAVRARPAAQPAMPAAEQVEQSPAVADAGLEAERHGDEPQGQAAGRGSGEPSSS